MQSIRLLTLTALLVSTGIVHAIDFKSVGAAPAVLYDAPSAKGIKQFVAPRGMPVEVVLTYGEWTKVRDAAGDLSWIETKALSSKRNLLVTAANAKVRASADDTAAIVFAVDKGVLLEWQEPVAAGWIKVRHRDGQNGYIRAAEVWGE